MKNIAILVTFLILTGSTLANQTQINAQQEQSEVTKFFYDFLHVWLVEQNIVKASEYFDYEKLNDNIRKFLPIWPNQLNPFDPPLFDSNVWIRKVLTMWLAQDHGEATMFNHGEPDRSDYSNLPLDPSGLRTRVHWQNVTEAMVLFFPIEKFTNRVNDRDNYLAMIRLNNAPRDGLLFLIERIDNKWKITFHTWFVA